MRRTTALAAVLIVLLGWIAAPALAAQEPAAPALAVPDFLAASPAPQAGVSTPEAPGGAVFAACTPSPLCTTNPPTCDASCRSRGAHFGACTTDHCCICVFKI